MNRVYLAVHLTLLHSVCWSEVGGGNAAVPNGAYFLLGARRGGRIRAQGFFVRPSVRILVISITFCLINIEVSSSKSYGSFMISLSCLGKCKKTSMVVDHFEQEFQENTFFTKMHFAL